MDKNLLTINAASLAINNAKKDGYNWLNLSEKDKDIYLKDAMTSLIKAAQRLEVLMWEVKGG